MMTPEICTISSDNLSTAWAKAFLKVVEHGVKEIIPLIVKVEKSDSDLTEENLEIRQLLDKQILDLKSKHSNIQQTHTVANTIFPQSLWNPNSKDNAQNLFFRFDKAWPRIKRCIQNRRGSYFRRLTAFRSEGNTPINQLEHIARTYKSGNHRRSALQASVFDPALDHKNSRQLGFPCLHQISFTPIDDLGLIVTGFYATQYIFDRAYGNYLGLCRLGRFMAKQMNMPLHGMTCIASVALLGTPSKKEVLPLADRLMNLIYKV